MMRYLASNGGTPASTSGDGPIAVILLVTLVIITLVLLFLFVVVLLRASRRGKAKGRSARAQPPQESAWDEAGRRVEPYQPPPKSDDSG